MMKWHDNENDETIEDYNVDDESDISETESSGHKEKEKE